jgi:hypothetical protein
MAQAELVSTARRGWITGANAIPSTTAGGNPVVVTAHTKLLAALAAHPPRLIPVDADAFDLEDRAEHLSSVFGGLAAYLAIVLDDTAQNVRGGLELPDVEVILADLASDLTGAILNGADEMAGRVE